MYGENLLITDFQPLNVEIISRYHVKILDFTLYIQL